MNERVKSVGMLVLVGLSLSVAGCGDGTSTVGPGGVTIASLAGTWNATLASWVPTAGGQEFELIAAGGSGVLVIESSGRFTFTTVDPDDETDVSTGTFAFDSEDEDFLIVRNDGEVEEDELFFILTGNTMRLIGEDEFDFDDDGVDEPATLTLEFTRS